MKCLFLHCHKFSYKLDHPTPIADIDVDNQNATYDNSMVVFIALEKSDDETKIESASKEIGKIANSVNAKSIVINPFAHLSSSLATPAQARRLLSLLTEHIRSNSKINVIYTSFGWYKSFIVDVYGHDNSQIFREF